MLLLPVYVRFVSMYVCVCVVDKEARTQGKHENNGAGNEALLLPLIDMTNTNTHRQRLRHTHTHTAKGERNLNQSDNNNNDGNKMKPGNGQTGNLATT